MKNINTLIKIHSRELDTLRQQVVKCEEEKSQLIKYSNKMEEELAVERALASQNHELGIIFSNYRRLIRERQEVIEKSLRDLAKKLERINEEIAIKFGEVKKFEIILANHISKEKKLAQARETKQLDEIAVNNFLNAELD